MTDLTLVEQELGAASRALGVAERNYRRAVKRAGVEMHADVANEGSAYDQAIRRYAAAIKALVGEPTVAVASSVETPQVDEDETSDIQKAVVSALANELSAMGVNFTTDIIDRAPKGLIEVQSLANAAMQYLHPVIGRDYCVVCDGTRGGMPGNENIVHGLKTCDYCTADQLTAQTNGQKDPVVAALEELAAIVEPRVVGSKKVSVRVAALRRVIGLARQAQVKRQITEVPDHVWKRIKNIVVDHLDLSPDNVVPTADFIDDLGADSLDAVELVMAFEGEFDIEISDDEAEEIKTVQDAALMVVRKT